METKHWIYFGLGTLATIPFALRILVQWILSEYHHKSHVTSSFWVLSTCGNILLLIHYLIQIQYHLYFIRFFPLYFGFRQLRLLKGNAPPFSWQRTARFLTATIILLTALFMLRVYFEHNRFIWVVNPQIPWMQHIGDISFYWHFGGFVGASIFASRLWVQWWQSEKKQKSVLGSSFWWISIIGGSITLSYALIIRDVITATNYCFSMIPYIRNLILIKRTQKVS